MNMANNFDNQFRSRSVQRSKRRKTNLILNSLIIIVVLLIIIVAYNIFMGGRDDQKHSSAGKNTESQHINKNKDTNNKKDENKENTATDENTDGEDQESSANVSDDEQQGLDSDEVVAEDSNDPNVIKSYTNPSWKSVGTEQTSGHQYSSDMNSTDWKEKESAMAYATGIKENNMVIWFLERNGSDNEVVGTISPKDQTSKTYRVYLSWVDGEGWKPTKVLELKVNDKR